MTESSRIGHGGVLAALLLAPVLLAPAAAAAGDPPAQAHDACTEQDGFERGHAGRTARQGCDDARYREALRLGAELATLEGERDRLAAEKGGDAAARARQQRLLEVDIDAIRALLLTRGVSVDAGPSPEHGA